MSYYAQDANYTPNSFMGQMFGTNPALYGGFAANSPAAADQAIIDQTEIAGGYTPNQIAQQSDSLFAAGEHGLVNLWNDIATPFENAFGAIGKFVLIGGIIWAVVALAPTANNLTARRR